MTGMSVHLQAFTSPEGTQTPRTPPGDTALHPPPTEMKRKPPEAEPNRAAGDDADGTGPTTSTEIRPLIHVIGPMPPAPPPATRPGPTPGDPHPTIAGGKQNAAEPRGARESRTPPGDESDF